MGINGGVYGACCVAYLALIALIMLRGRVSITGIGIIAACVFTAAWAANSAIPAIAPAQANSLLDSLRLSLWLILMVGLVGSRQSRLYLQHALPLAFLLTIGFCVIIVANEAAIMISNAHAGVTDRLHDLLRVGLGVAGLLATENVLRNAGEHRRGVWPLCLGLGTTFAFALFLDTERLMVPDTSPLLSGGSGLVSLFAVPLLALAMARNREWRVDIHVSRTVVLHTAALVASGVFFLALATIGVVVRKLGGYWGPPLQLLTLVGSAIVLVVVLGSYDLRSQLKHVIARHFFSHRFDYRAEWLRFVDTVSKEHDPQNRLASRVVRALAQIVDSPAGVLWSLHEGATYVPEAGWKVLIDHRQKLAVSHPFVTGFRDGTWIQECPGTPTADWPFEAACDWLAVPLVHRGAIIAFVVLAPPSHKFALDWESFDLLRTAGRQAAGYLAEEQSTRALVDAHLLNEYSKKFAFVVHDIKNLAAQLGLVVSNARRHLNNPDFREDMMQTLDASVERINQLLAQLRTGAQQPEVIEPDMLIESLARELSSVGKPIKTRLEAQSCRVAINGEQFRSILSHLINNALEATRTEAVIVASRRLKDNVAIEVVDSGPGMDEQFIRDELFRPFRTSKTDGLGIGAYQTRELLRMAGGELEVISTTGVGTVMRMTLPVHVGPQLTLTAA